MSRRSTRSLPDGRWSTPTSPRSAKTPGSSSRGTSNRPSPNRSPVIAPPAARAMLARRLFTIGYQGAALYRFIACLQANDIRTLADIRFHPFSRRPEFRQGALRSAVEQAGLAYRHFKDLGNPPASRAAAMAGDEATYRRLFLQHLATPA